MIMRKYVRLETGYQTFGNYVNTALWGRRLPHMGVSAGFVLGHDTNASRLLAYVLTKALK